MMTIYLCASSIRLSGVLRMRSMGYKNVTLRTVSTRAHMTPSTYDAATALRTPFSSCAPKNLAVITAKPLVSPVRSPTISVLRGLVSPTAANAWSPRNSPTMRVSTKLYVSWRTFARKMGIANCIITFMSLPLVKSFIIC